MFFKIYYTFSQKNFTYIPGIFNVYNLRNTVITQKFKEVIDKLFVL